MRLIKQLAWRVSPGLFPGLVFLMSTGIAEKRTRLSPPARRGFCGDADHYSGAHSLA